MPTVGERLATLEAGQREIRDDLHAVIDLLNGGREVTYDRSVRGRLHIIENALAGMVLRRNYGVGMLKGWQSVILLGCAVATAAAAWYAALG
jgi:hypothetical protein